MSQFSTPLLTFFCISSFVCIDSYAFDHDDLLDVDISGFATIAFAQTVTDDKKEGDMDGMTGEPELEYFNKLGLRFDSDLTENLAFTLQMVANGEDRYEPKVDWAFIDYRVNNRFKMSAGKMRMPLYMLSEFKDVSYAYQWVTPPYAVYGSPSFSSFNGGKLNYSVDIGGEWTTTFDMWAGRLKDFLNVGGIGGYRVNFDVDDMYGVSVALDRDWLFVRAVYMQGLSTSDIAPVIVSQLGVTDERGVPELNKQLADNGLYEGISGVASSTAVTLDKDDVRFVGLGAILDFSQVFFSAELTYIKSDPNIIVGKAISYYVLAGIRAPHDLSFSFTYAKDFNRPAEGAERQFKEDFWQVANEVRDDWRKPLDPNADPDEPGKTLDPPTDELLENIYLQANDLLVKKFATLDTKTYIFSSRWDFHSSASLKAEYLFKEQTKYTVDSSPQAIRLAIDFVF